MPRLKRVTNLSELRSIWGGNGADEYLVIDLGFDDRIERLRLKRGMSPETIAKELIRFAAWLEHKERRAEIESGEEFR